MTQPIAKLLAFVISLSIFMSCKKTEIIEPKSIIETEAKKFLKTQMTEEDLKKLDWAKLKEYKKLGKTQIIQIPLIGSNKLEDKVIYLRVVGNSFAGNYFQQEGNSISSKITTTSFDKARVCVANIENNQYDGSYDVYKNGVLVSGNVLNTTSSRRIRVPASILYNNQLHVFISMLNVGDPNWNLPQVNGSTTLEYIEPIGEETGNPNDGAFQEPIVEIYVGEAETETIEYNSGPSIDLQKYKNCFGLVSSAGATYTIKLCADIPVNDDPYKINTMTDPGHVFMTFTKTNGANSVTQSFGFYPRNGTVPLLGIPVSSKIVDDENHEYNASIQMNVTEANFLASFSAGQTNASSSYDINDYNCAYFALDNFNTIRPNPLAVPYTYTTTGAFFGKTPVGLYQTLQYKKTHNDPEQNNIQIGLFSSPDSHGPCN